MNPPVIALIMLAFVFGGALFGLLVSSAKDSFDRFDDELTQNAARVVMLDRTLDEYGPQAKDTRDSLKVLFAKRIELLYATDDVANNATEGRLAITQQENVDVGPLALIPEGRVQQGLQAQAVELNTQINMTNALIHAQRADSMPSALMIVL